MPPGNTNSNMIAIQKYQECCVFYLHCRHWSCMKSAPEEQISYDQLWWMPFKQQLDRISQAGSVCIMLLSSKAVVWTEWRMMAVLPLLSAGISIWRQGRGNPLRHTTTHTDTGVMLDPLPQRLPPSPGPRRPPPPHCYSQAWCLFSTSLFSHPLHTPNEVIHLIQKIRRTI